MFNTTENTFHICWQMIHLRAEIELKHAFVEFGSIVLRKADVNPRLDTGIISREIETGL